MSTSTPNTVAEKVVLAGYLLEDKGQSPFTAEALIVTAWKEYPSTFGLRSYVETYPDSNKVLASIMGRRGLTKRGWFAKVGQKQYELTREGRQIARRLLFPDQQPEEAPLVVLSEDQDQLLQQFFASSALEKFQQDQLSTLTFVDACRFWGITECLQAENVDDHLQNVQTKLMEIDRLLGTKEAGLRDGRSVGADDVKQFGDLHALLEKRFTRHLNLLRHRSLQAS